MLRYSSASRAYAACAAAVTAAVAVSLLISIRVERPLSPLNITWFLQYLLRKHARRCM